MSKSRIAIYAREIEDGLAESIAQQQTLAYCIPLKASPESLASTFLNRDVEKQRAVAENGVDKDVSFDLYPVHTILVTTGWNNNDDIFDKQETWAARCTPEHKPFNIGHTPRHIIGHITGNRVIADDFNVLGDDLTFEELPDTFHILTSAVIYRHLSSKDQSLEQEAAELISQIESGEWFVSMECLFSAFDYGIMHASGENELVARNTSTAFLTKKLRAYGGDGTYNGGKLGRVLRNITFSGKGLVQNPANPNSVIINDTQRFSGVFASASMPDSIVDNQGDLIMAENDKYVSQLEAQTKGLQEQLVEANKRIEELGDATVKASLAEKDSQIDSLNSEVETLKNKVSEVEASLIEATKVKSEIEAAKAEVDKQLAEATEKMAEVERQSRATARISMLVDKGIEKADAETVVAEFDELGDEKFAKIVELKTQAANVDTSTEKETSDDDDDSAGEATAGEADLGNAKADDDAALSDGGSDGQDDLMASLASYLETSMQARK